MVLFWLSTTCHSSSSLKHCYYNLTWGFWWVAACEVSEQPTWLPVQTMGFQFQAISYPSRIVINMLYKHSLLLVLGKPRLSSYWQKSWIVTSSQLWAMYEQSSFHYEGFEQQKSLWGVLTNQARHSGKSASLPSLILDELPAVHPFSLACIGCNGYHVILQALYCRRTCNECSTFIEMRVWCRLLAESRGCSPPV